MSNLLSKYTKNCRFFNIGLARNRACENKDGHNTRIFMHDRICNNMYYFVNLASVMTRKCQDPTF